MARSEASIKQRAAYARWYVKQNREDVRRWGREHYAKNKDAVLRRKKTAARRLRMEVLLAYGAECQCCGENRYEFLAFDHVDSDGAEHRRTIGANSLPRWLKRNNYPDGFQVLCHNCNGAKGAYGVCPHVLDLL